ncbi:MAG: NUDIX hydrolase [Mycobacteriales bacterium]
MTAGWPDGLAPRVADLAAGRVTPVEPRDASTVLLLRDWAAGLEVFLIRRVRSMAFAAGMHAFPGGSVEPGDGDWIGELPAGWAAALAAGDEDLGRCLVGAAVRETWEECGVLLADRPPVPGDGLSGIALRTELLRPWAHWCTPEVEVRRFDTRFFVAALPAGQVAELVGREADEGRWVRPSDAADLAALPPTIHALAELAAFRDVAGVLAAPREVTRVLPRVVLDGASVRLLLPWDEGYPGAG